MVAPMGDDEKYGKIVLLAQLMAFMLIALQLNMIQRYTEYHIIIFICVGSRPAVVWGTIIIRQIKSKGRNMAVCT